MFFLRTTLCEEKGNYSAYIFLKVQAIDCLGFCNRDVAAELTWTYSRVPKNQWLAP